MDAAEEITAKRFELLTATSAVEAANQALADARQGVDEPRQRTAVARIYKGLREGKVEIHYMTLLIDTGLTREVHRVQSC